MFSEQGITLSKVSSEDLNHLLELKQESWRHTHTTPIINMDDQIRWFESIDSNISYPTDIYLIANEKDKLKKFGLFKINNIDWVSRCANVGWDVFKEYRNKGMGKRLVTTGVLFCDKVLNLRRLTAEILHDNIASQKCAEHAGFEKEGCKRQAIFKYGNYLDSYIYGRI